MGVPGFVAWLRDHFKDRMILTSLQEKVKILYIDGNCLVHPKCFEVLSNIIDPDITIEKLEKLMFRRICKFINYLVGFVKPEICYFAIDGVGPAAKINQQRFRRYKSMMDNEIIKKIKNKHKKKSLIEWSNTVITPGTEFMKKLDIFLKQYFNECREQNPKIQYIYTSYLEPGEGEHKILEHMRNTMVFNVSDISVIYGLDADLFFLAMCSNKKNVFLLREENQFVNGAVQKHEIVDIVDDVAEDMRFVSIDITKECYNIRIKQIVRNRIEQVENYDIHLENNTLKINNNKINEMKSRDDYCSDFVFICYLLGNDFIPHLPTIQIKKNGLDIIIDTYVDTYLTLGTPLIEITNTNHSNRIIKINNIFFIEMLRIFGDLEAVYYNEILPKYEFRNRKKRCTSSDPYQIDIWELENMKNIKEILGISKHDPIMCGHGDKNTWKFRYYDYYFGVSEHQEDFINLISMMYVDGLKWVTEYYYNGCPSWKWKFPYIQAPFISDIYMYLKKTNFDINEIKFNMGEPLSPERQLLAVLPYSCADLLSKEYRYLMTDAKSPIIDMYPKKVDLEMIHKDLFRECIPKLPYLDIDRIINATRK